MLSGMEMTALQWILTIFGTIGATLFTGYMAKKRGRSVYKWAVAGFFFGLLACGVLFILPPLIRRRESFPAPSLPDGFWYYLDRNEGQHGPMSLSSLRRQRPDIAYVWHESMDTWKTPESLSI